MDFNNILSSDRLINYYLNYKSLLMGISMSVMIIMVLMSLDSCENKMKSFKKIIRGIINASFQYFIVVFTGIMFIFVKLTKDIDFGVFFNIMVIISILLILRFIYILVFFKSSFPKLHLETVKYLKIILLSIVGFTVSKNNFGYNELLISLMYMFLLSYTVFLINEHSSSINDKNRKHVSLRSEMPIHEKKDLYPSRRRQLDNFIEYYSMDENEKKSIAIRGAWGYGKTSFVNALKSSIKSETIHIIPSIDSSNKSMFIQLTKRFEEIFEKNGIYTGRGSNLDKYTKYILSLVSTDKTNLVGMVSGMLDRDKSTEFYELLNDLEDDILNIKNDANKDILVIFDDMDRCFEKKLKEALQFLNIVLSLQGINMLFLFDNNQVRKIGISDEFINKYFDTLIDVCSLEYEEIVDYIEEKEMYFDSEFTRSLHNHLKEQIKNYSGNNRYFLKNKLNSMKKKFEEKNISKDTEFDEVIKKLSDKIVNPRYIKNFYKEIERVVLFVNRNWFNDPNKLSNDYSKGDWMDYIASIVMLKIFFIDKYDEVLRLGSIKSILKSKNLNVYTEYILSIEVSPMDKFLEQDNYGEKEAIMNFILFSNDEKSYSQSISVELAKGIVDEVNIISEFQSIVWNESKRIEGTKVLIDSISNIDNDNLRNEVLLEFFSAIKKITSSFREVELEIFKYLEEKFKNSTIKLGLADKNLLVGYIEEIIENYIFGAGGVLKYYLQLVSVIKKDEKELELKQFADEILDLENICTSYF